MINHLIILTIYFSNGSSTSNVTSVDSRVPKEKEQYIIYPGTERQSKKYRSDLQTLVGAENVNEYGTSSAGVLFWLVNLDKSQAQDFSTGNPNAVIRKNEALIERQYVKAAHQDNETTLRSPKVMRDRGINYETNPPADLKVVSWPPNKLAKDLNYFAYDQRGGRDVVLYVIEEGLDVQNPEFAFNQIAWRYAPIVRSTMTDDDSKFHGSCVVSKAVGTRYGISKGTSVVIVKSSLNESDVIWAFGNIADEMSQADGNRQRSVVLFASGSIVHFNPNRPFAPPEPWNRIRAFMRTIIGLDGIIVVPSGNGRRGSYRGMTDILPAMFTRAPFGYLPLTLVGSCHNDGVEAPFSQQSPYIKAWAPGSNVQCAQAPHEDEMESGTSVSAGMVAGLAAYFLGNASPPFDVGGGQTALNFNNFLRSKASWRRSSNAVPNMVWNLQDGTRVFPLPNSVNASNAPSVAVA
ncbi:hypothetical protein ACLMJK_001639 [Lecanora helva]